MGFNFQVIIKISGFVTVIISIAMISALSVSLLYREWDMAKSFVICIVPMLILGLVLILSTKSLTSTLKMRESVLTVALCWVLASLLGAMPYYISGELSSFIDAFFESVSGFSTTGASVIDNLESLPHGLIFWRSLSHWLGGMGILVFAISILPALGIGAQNIAKAETTGPTLDKVTTRISDNAKILYLIYLGFSLIELILLLLGGLNFFDALIHTFGSMGTGGLSNYQEGVGHFDNTYVEMIVSIFSVLASLNFIAYGHILSGKIKEFFREPEIRAFFAIFAIAIAVITVTLMLTHTYDSIGETLRYTIFQVASFMSTSGYVTTDYEVWPAFARFIMFSLLFIGGCSASTAGSIKVIRIAVMFQLIRRNFFKRIHPRAVTAVKISGKPVSAETVSNITVFILLYFLTFLVASLVISLENCDLLTTLGTAAGTLSNTGVGFGEIGPGETYSNFSAFGRFFLSILMLVGRLELFTIIALLTKSFWAPNRQ